MCVWVAVCTRPAHAALCYALAGCCPLVAVCVYYIRCPKGPSGSLLPCCMRLGPCTGRMAVAGGALDLQLQSWVGVPPKGRIVELL